MFLISAYRMRTVNTGCNDFSHRRGIKCKWYRYFMRARAHILRPCDENVWPRACESLNLASDTWLSAYVLSWDVLRLFFLNCSLRVSTSQRKGVLLIFLFMQTTRMIKTKVPPRTQDRFPALLRYSDCFATIDFAITLHHVMFCSVRIYYARECIIGD